MLSLLSLLLPLSVPCLAQEGVFPAHPLSPGPWTLHLTDGTRLFGSPQGGGADALQFQPTSSAVSPFSVNLLSVRALTRGFPLLGPSPSQDRVRLQTPDGIGDLHEGWLLGCMEGGLSFEENGTTHFFTWSRIQSLELLPEETPTQLGTDWVLLQDGSFFRGKRQPQKKEEPWTFQTEAMGEVILNPANLLRVRQENPLEQSLAWEIPLLRKGPRREALIREPQRMRSVEGRPLTVGGVAQGWGWGMLAPSTLKFSSIAGTLHFGLGFDSETQSYLRRAPVTAQLFLEEALLWEKIIFPAQEATWYSVPLLKPGVLTLTVSSDGPGAHVDWLDPVISPSSLASVGEAALR